MTPANGAAGNDFKDQGPQPDGLPVPRRYWAITAIVLGITMAVLDSSIANVALPTIGNDFHATKAATIWVVNAYQVAILVCLLPLATLGEIVGYRRISQFGMIVFTLASLGCALSTSLLTLSIARVIQGVGAAGIMSVNAALVRFTYPHRLLGRAIGINSFAVAVCSAIGPTIAAAVLAVGHWRWLFGINIPLGIVTIVIATYALPHTERATRPLNYVSVALSAGMFALIISGLQALAHDTTPLLALVQIAGGCALGAMLVKHDIGQPAPLLPFDLLRIRAFRLSIATSVSAFMAQIMGLVALPFEIQRLGHSAVATGLLMTPWPVAVALAAPVAGRLADRYPAGILGGIGLSALGGGLLSLATFTPDGTAADFAWRMALCGLGFGFFQSPNNRAILSSAPRARSGATGGLMATARLLGQSLGAALVAILFHVYSAQGSNVALYVSAGIALLAALISLSRLTGPQR